jgi:hypothetical protein
LPFCFEGSDTRSTSLVEQAGSGPPGQQVVYLNAQCSMLNARCSMLKVRAATAPAQNTLNRLSH